MPCLRVGLAVVGSHEHFRGLRINQLKIERHGSSRSGVGPAHIGAVEVGAGDVEVDDVGEHQQDVLTLLPLRHEVVSRLFGQCVGEERCALLAEVSLDAVDVALFDLLAGAAVRGVVVALPVLTKRQRSLSELMPRDWPGTSPCCCAEAVDVKLTDPQSSAVKTTNTPKNLFNICNVLLNT